MLFKDIIGQEETKKRLLALVKEGRIPHAMLFSGPEGCGKLPLAIAYAQYLCCTDRKGDEACGVCPSCLQFGKLAHPDLHFVFPIYKPDSKKKWICDDFLSEWREFILKQPYFSYNEWMDFLTPSNAQGMIYADESSEILRKLNLKSYESVYKVMIIWLPEKMHQACSNKLLKILEEPPTNTIFLLITEDAENIINTIYSRTQQMVMHGIDPEDMETALKTHFPDFQQKELAATVHLAGGSWTKAMRIVQSGESDRFNLQQFIRCMRNAYTIAHFAPQYKIEKQDSLKDLKIWSEEMAKIGRERQKQYLSFAQRMIRENFILNLGQPEISYLNPSEEAFSSKFFPFINEKNIEGFMKEFELAEKHIEQNVQAKMVFFDLALKAILLFK